MKNGLQQICRRHAVHDRCNSLLPTAFLLAVFFLTIGFAVTITGCHSAFVQTTITNQGAPIRTVELDYPSQSFGTEILQTSQVFHYRFKVQGSGPVKLQFMDGLRKMHTSTGPTLAEGSEGSLSVTVTRTGDVLWSPLLAGSNKH